MALRNAQPFTFRASGVCDATDGSNAPDGAMSSLKNLIPNPKMARQFVPRPASVQVSSFATFTTPAKINALLQIGNRAYGMIASARFAGKDEPFCYDLAAAAFVTIAGPTATNCPTSPATSGDWVPPIMTQVGRRILVCHPGYAGGATKFGWIDMRSFTLASLTGDTHTTTVIDNLSGNPINLGVAVGDTVAGAGIPANTRVVSMTATAILLSAAATATAAGIALTFTSGTAAAPLYGAGDTNTNNLAATPLSAGQFNGRAYFAVSNGLVYTDSLKPWQVTNATQALTLGDDTAVTALAGQPLSSQLGGGIVQSLTAFKGAEAFWQVTGDSATSDLKVDQIAGSIGTLAPLTICSTPKGTAFVSPDGLRIIDPVTGRADEPVGADGMGVTLPFIYAINPSRMCAAYNKNLMRISVQNGSLDAQPMQEWWFHFNRALMIWTGPHDFPAGVIQACVTGQTDFVLAASGVDAKLFQSNISPSAASTYTENGAAMSWMWTTSLMPENQSGQALAIVESSLGLSLPATQTLTVGAFDEGNNTLNTVTLAGNGGGQAIWNAFTWGVGVWGGSVAAFRQYQMEWTEPLIFKQASISCYGPSVNGFTIGNFLAKLQFLGYQKAWTA